MTTLRAVPACFTYSMPGRPEPYNATRYRHWRTRNDEVQRIRAEAKLITSSMLRGRPSPLLGKAVKVTVQPYLDRMPWPDVGAYFDVVKAALDGMVDAGLLDGDGPDVVVRTIHEAPIRSKDQQLEIIVEEA